MIVRAELRVRSETGRSCARAAHLEQRAAADLAREQEELVEVDAREGGDVARRRAGRLDDEPVLDLRKAVGAWAWFPGSGRRLLRSANLCYCSQKRWRVVKTYRVLASFRKDTHRRMSAI